MNRFKLLPIALSLLISWRAWAGSGFAAPFGVMLPSTRCATIDATSGPAWASLSSYFSFSAASGSIANGATVTASAGGGAVASNVGGAGMSYVTGYAGNALSLDGIDDYLSIADADNLSPSVSSNHFTLSLWARIDENSTAGGDGSNFRKYMVAKGTGGQYEYNLHRLAGAADNVQFCLFSLDGLSAVCRDLVTGYAINTWYHLAVVMDGTNLVTFLNGRPANSTAITPTTGNGTAPLRIGMRDNGYFKGQIDELAVWNTDLTASQVLALYEMQLCNK